jgi:site-specific DNA-methyltransferase (adenine-specific)
MHSEPAPTVIGNATLYCGDALRVLAALPDESVDCAMTDPPYSSGGMLRGDRIQDVHTKYVNSDSASGNLLTGFTGDNRDQIGYWFWTALWLGELRRVLKPGAVVGLFTDWRQLPVTTSSLQAGGFVWRGIIPWHKPAARCQQGRFTNNCEYVVWGTNGPRELEGSPLPGFYSCNAPRGEDREHITQKPVELMARLISVTPPGSVVIDPFMGSGTTGVACMDTGRLFVGIEQEQSHFATACERLDQTQRQVRLFDGATPLRPMQADLGWEAA